jgi:phage-related protein
MHNVVMAKDDDIEEVMKPIEWVASSRSDLREFPLTVKKEVGDALSHASLGSMADFAKPLKGFGGASVIEIVVSHDSNAFRAVYTVQFEQAIYVLHCFQKKSHEGRKTPPHEMELIRTRLAQAEVDYANNYES